MEKAMKRTIAKSEEPMSLDEAIEEIREHGWLIDFRPIRGLKALRVIDKALKDYRQLQKDYEQLQRDYNELKEKSK